MKANSKVRFQKDVEYRIDKPDYAERAITEAIVNALIHCSYLLPGSEIHIDMYDDRLEITSPGGLVDGSTIQSKDIFNIESQRRNPVIADLFHRMRFMERRGSGLRDIVGETAKLPGYSEEMKPEFVSTNSSFRVIIKNVNYTLKSNNEPINEPINLNERERLVLCLIKENAEITRKELMNRMQCSESTVKRVLDSLVNKNIICRIGSRKKGSWEINKDVK